MRGWRTTFLGLFDEARAGRPAVSRVEIPIIQRDYAQGRPDAAPIRERFVEAVVDAAVGPRDLGLDFVYGEVGDAGVLHPLDGQQRLTTLYLLHWYVASLARRHGPELPCLKLSYATRPTARDFSLSLAEHAFPLDAGRPSGWITDQPWFVHPWKQDPTISSMLVVLDEIHRCFSKQQVDFGTTWARLADREEEAIWFLFLPVENSDHGEDLYIKMNSRGKPLEPFEVFKADLEDFLEPELDTGELDRLKGSLDGAWTDLLWGYEKAGGGDFVVDDEFVRYFTFIVDVCRWWDEATDLSRRDIVEEHEGSLSDAARLVFTSERSTSARRNREFLFHAFDTWCQAKDPSAALSALFKAGDKGTGSLPLLASRDPDLFGACISTYGAEREFTLAETLLLFGVLRVRQADPPLDQAVAERRLRTLRNLAESAVLDRKRMSDYVAATDRLVVDGVIQTTGAFRSEWAADEQLKWNLMDEHPEVVPSIHLLEDSPVVRGRLLAFDLDTSSLERRASAWHAVAAPALRDTLGAALLTKGDYSRAILRDGTRRQLGSSLKEDSWRDLLTTGGRASVEPTRARLMELLDDVSERLSRPGATPGAVLDDIRDEWLLGREQDRFFDWRYYLAKYSGARSSVGDGFFHDDRYDADRGGFSCGRIDMLHGSSYSAYYSDTLLLAAWTEGGLHDIAAKPSWWRTYGRGLTMRRSGVEVKSVEAGLELDVPPDQPATEGAVRDVLTAFAAVDGLVLPIEQHPGQLRADTVDRVALCARLVRALDDAGL